MKKECRFCNIVENNGEQYGEIDRPFLENDLFFSLVSIGAFCKGWTLLITKKHKYNLKDNYEQSSFCEYLNRHLEVLRNKMQWRDRIIAFEHGANKCDSETACGTSHAHLHILPFRDSILAEIKAEKSWIECQWSEVAGIVGNEEYLLYCENPEKGLRATVFVHIVQVPESQYFRRILFQKLGLAGDYSYKEDQRIQESLKTVEILKE